MKKRVVHTVRPIHPGEMLREDFLPDIREYKDRQESITLLKILAQSKICLEEGAYKPAAKAFKDLRTKWAAVKWPIEGKLSCK